MSDNTQAGYGAAHRAIKHVLDLEGGYSDDPADSGGKTRYGITEDVARNYGYLGAMSDLPIETAEKIYLSLYWHSLHLDRVAARSELIATELFDTAVNMGVGRAGTFLQRSLNVLNDSEKLYVDITVDGAVGDKTVAAFNSYLNARKEPGEVVLMKMLNALQGSQYVTLAENREKDERFIFGWFLNRV